MLIQVKGCTKAIRVLLVLLCVVEGNELLAKGGYFDFNHGCKKIYHKVTSLQLDEAETLIRNQKIQEPENLILDYLNNYIDFFILFIGEEDYEFKKREHHEALRLKRLSSGNRNSPYYLYCLAEINLQWALIRLKQEEYFKAYSEIRSAYKYLEKNTRLYPQFMPNLKSLGILHALIGTIPDRFKGLFSFFSGMRGTIQQGREEVETVLRYAQNREFIFKDETIIMYAFLLLHLKNEGDEAWQLVQEGSIQNKKSPLYTFAASSVAMHTGRNDDAIKILSRRTIPTGSYPFYYLDFVLGTAKLRRLDPDADTYLLTFVTHFKGRNYIKEAYQKLAWSALVDGKVKEYEKYLEKCEKFGKAILDEDKSALLEAQSKSRPRVDLLKGRLLFDGGYYVKALQILETAEKNLSKSNKADYLEYIYRKGRVYQALNRIPEAIRFYQLTIELGSEAPKYYACKSALLIGNIFESQGKMAEARKYYKACLRIYPAEFRTSLHQKAKAGINRMLK